MSLHVGDLAPEWNLLAAHNGEIVETSLRGLLDGHIALVLSTYPLDFTGG